MVVRDGGRTVFRGRIGIERRGQSSQRVPEEVVRRSSCATARATTATRAARDARRRRLGPLRGLQRQDADAQRARLRDRAPHGPLRRPHAVRRGAARRPLPRRLRADGEARAARGPGRRGEPGSCSSGRSAGRRARRDAPSGCRSAATTSCSRTPSARTSARKRAARSAAAVAPPSARCTARPARAGWRAHLDEGAAVDFLLVNELFKNQDAFRASTYLHAGRRRALAARPGVGLRHLDGQLRLRRERDGCAARCSRSARGAAALQRPGVRRRDAARAGGSCARAGLQRLSCCASVDPTRRAAERDRRGGAQLPPLAGARRARLAQPARGGAPHDLRGRGARAALVARPPDRLARRQRRQALSWARRSVPGRQRIAPVWALSSRSAGRRP